MLKNIRNSKSTKRLAVLLALLILQPYFSDLKIVANAGGPTQPEFAKYSAVNVKDYVDPFSGNVMYSIPLFEIGGYPVSLSYSGDINPQADAGWVGLGWNLNLGSINRALRGTPDDFNGDLVKVDVNNKPSINANIVFNNVKSETVGMQTRNGNEGLGKGKFKLAGYKLSLTWDNNTGIGIGYGMNWEKRTDKHSVSDPWDLSKYDSIPDLKAELIKEGLGNIDTAFAGNKYTAQMGLDYSSKSRTSVSTAFINNNKTGKLGFLNNVSLNFNSRSSQYDLGFQTGQPINNSMNCGYIPNFSKHSAMQVPPPSTRTRTYTLSLEFSKGTAVKQTRKLSGLISVTEEHIVNKSENKPAFGYFHMTNKNYPDGVILDCEELPNSLDRQMEKYSRQLSPASKTYDVFNISASGVGGSFRAHHNSVFMMYPSESGSKPYVNNIKLKGEFGKTEIGVDIGIGIVKEKYGAIPEGYNDIVKKLKFKDESLNSTFEHTTFRNEYEFIESNNNYFNAFGNTNAMRPNIANRLGRFGDKMLDKDKQQILQITGQVSKSARDARQQMISCYTAKQTEKISMFGRIENYQRDLHGNPDFNVDGTFKISYIDRNDPSSYRKDHHISEIQVLQPDGSRYFFSTPVYNRISKDVNFDASELNKSNFNFLNGTLKYSASDLKATDKGTKARFYNAKEIPAYASTYLLNAVISPDYVDIDGNGPSENDIGNYVKFNYSLHNITSSGTALFKWRSPVESGTAYLNAGYKSDNLDDKGYYSYGEKEIWYAHSIETKDRIVLFFLKPRLDGWGVGTEFGGISTSGVTQQYLHQIVVYSRNEFKENGVFSEPLKVVNFDYSYDLCKNYTSYKSSYTGGYFGPDEAHPLNSSEYEGRYKGKLTLHKVWFTYGKIGIATEAPYVFEYNTINPDYANRSVDKWGVYLPESYYQPAGVGNNSINSISSSDFPYTPQNNPSSVDQWASAWMLSDITLPAGGKIHFDYESDDYAYVQNKTAMRMIKIHGVNNEGKIGGSGDELYNNQSGLNKNYYILFEKPGGNSIPASSYFQVGDLVYYNFNVKISKKNKNDNAYEYVSGFFEIEEIGNASDNSQYGYIKVKKERAGMFNAHPVTRMALQYGMNNVPHNLYPGSDMRRAEDKFKARAIADMVFGVIPDIMSMLMGKYNYFEKFGFCQKLKLDRSYIRIPEIDGYKKGGGHRVKKVTLSDNWGVMTEYKESTSEYAIEYTYQTTDNAGNSISSGVASYEPDAGAEENPWKEPLNADAIKKMRGKRMKPLISYDMGPVGEEFFGSPSVGYSKVKIANVYPNINIVRHKSGYTIKEFYTAKDFPSITERTPIELKKIKFGTPNLSGTFKSKTKDENQSEEEKEKDENEAEKKKKTKFGSLSLDISASFSFITATQGISVETNDMHGKPKAEWSYADDNIEPLSGTEYFYKKRDIDKLSNDITVLRPNLAVSKTTAGLSIEPTLFGSQHISSVHNIRPNFNIDRTGPAILFNVLPGYSLHREQSRLVTCTKHITRRGIIDSIVVHEKGARISTKNIAWDALTGQVLLSSLNNEFGDEVYNLLKPAHWMYKGMSGAYENQNIQVELNIASGTATDPSNMLFPGDELFLDDLSTDATYYILDRNGSNVTIIDENGGSFMPNGTYKFRVKRSGHRNVLGFTAESITVLKNPINYSTNTFSVDKDWVVDAKAFLFEDLRKVLTPNRFCFSVSCPEEFPIDSIIPDTTSFGMHLIHFPDSGLIPYVSPIGGEIIEFGRPQFDNCCEVGGGGEGFYSPPGGEDHCMMSCGSGGYELGQSVNPYKLGIRGIWNVNGEYVYFEKRNGKAQRTLDINIPGDLNSTTMRFDGRLVDFKEFWVYSSLTWTPFSTQSVNNPWTCKNTTTHIDNYGNGSQFNNALDVKSAQLYGYNNRNLVTSVATNALHRNIMFDGFEDINVNSYLEWHCDSLTSNLIGPTPFLNPYWIEDFCNQYRHWPIAKALLGGNNRITDKVSHTGWKSLQLGRGTTEIPLDPINTSIVNFNTAIPLSNYSLGSDDFIDRFYPQSNQEYVISMWVKESYRNQFQLMLEDNFGNPISSIPESAEIIIDGWRKLTMRFSLSSSQYLGNIKFINNAPLKNLLSCCYLDDIRVFPAASTMKTYVYSYMNYRFMATLDENNYATMLEYDEEGHLVRHKLETEKGIMTLDESRKNTRR